MEYPAIKKNEERVKSCNKDEILGIDAPLPVELPKGFIMSAKVAKAMADKSNESLFKEFKAINFEITMGARAGCYEIEHQFDSKLDEHDIDRMIRRLRRLGYDVNLKERGYARTYMINFEDEEDE